MNDNTPMQYRLLTGSELQNLIRELAGGDLPDQALSRMLRKGKMAAEMDIHTREYVFSFADEWRAC